MVELTAVDPADATRVAGLGETLTDVGQVRLEVRAPGADGDSAELWRDGVLVEAVTVAGGVASFERAVTGARERYRVELTGLGGRLTVTSHVYVEGDPALAEGGGGCCQGGGGAPAWPLGLGVLAALRRRRARR